MIETGGETFYWVIARKPVKEGMVQPITTLDGP